MKNNISLIISISLLIFIVVRVFIGFADRNNSLNSENVKITVGEITDLKHGAKTGLSVYYSFYFVRNIYNNKNFVEGELRGSSNLELDKYIGKKYFVKFSVEKPKYSEIYLDKPVPKNFVYEEGQTWENIPIN